MHAYHVLRVNDLLKMEDVLILNDMADYKHECLILRLKDRKRQFVKKWTLIGKNNFDREKSAITIWEKMK